MLLFDNFVFDYKPFPIGVAKPFLEPGLYRELASTYPNPAEFAPFRVNAGGQVTKFSLSGRTDARLLAGFLDRHPAWRTFYEYLYSAEFMDTLLDHLEHNGLRVLKKRSRGLNRWINRAAPRLARAGVPGIEQLIHDLPRKTGGVASKLEFSAIPANDGGLLPHTDSPGKIVTLVLAFPEEGEWDPAYGGGTSIVEPLDDREYFNPFNKSLPFEAVDVQRVVEYQPNQAMLFIKTFNSWHAVMPTHGPAGLWRKTLTVNVMSE